LRLEKKIKRFFIALILIVLSIPIAYIVRIAEPYIPSSMVFMLIIVPLIIFVIGLVVLLETIGVRL